MRGVDTPEDLSSHVVVGPCTDGCPAPTAIACIQVPKVYDFCFLAESFANVSASLEGCPAEPGATVSCAVAGSTCAFVSATPIDESDFRNVTFAVTVVDQVTVTSPGGQTCTVSLTLSFAKTVTLCAPQGTVQTCEVAGAVCGPCVVVGRSVSCTVQLCLVFLSTAQVALLVPTYGFCTPSACVVSPAPPCPPAFPAACPAPAQGAAGS